MGVTETLGVPAHPGGMLVERPELTVGLVRVTSSPAGLEVELIARRPPDRRTATQRQADIRNGRDVPTIAAGHLLPAFDEGMDLRFATLDEHGRARWWYPTRLASYTGGSDGRFGQSLRAVYQLPPLFDTGSFVLAWPEIGFPETVVHLTLPDRATVERDTIRIWQTPPPPTSAAEAGLSHGEAPIMLSEVEVERGRSIAAPRLLRRAENVVVVLRRLTAAGPDLSMEIKSEVRGEMAASITAQAFPPRNDESARRRSGAAIAVVHGTDARWLRPHEASASGGPDAFQDISEYILQRPYGDTLELIVGWTAAGLPEARLSIALIPALD